MSRFLVPVLILGSLPAWGFGSKPTRKEEAKNSAAAHANPARNPADTVEQLSRMNAEERMRALSALPPAQQAFVSRGLERLDQLTPAAREQWLTRFRRFQSLSPEQKTDIRKMVMKFLTLPEPRRLAIKTELDALSKLSDAQRAQVLSSEDFRDRFNPGEREIIEKSSQVLPDL